MYTTRHLAGCTPRQFYELASNTSCSDEEEEECSHRVSHTTMQCNNNHRTVHEEEQQQQEEEEKSIIESLQAQLQRCETMLHRLSAQQLRYDVAVEARLELMQRTLDEALQTRSAYLQECVQQLRRRCAEAWQQQRDALDELSCELAACTRVQLRRQQQTQQQEEAKKDEEHHTTPPATPTPAEGCASELCSLAPPVLQAVRVTCAVPSSCPSASCRSHTSVSSSQRSSQCTQSACEGDDFITPSPPYATHAAASLSSSQRRYGTDGDHHIYTHTYIQTTPYTVVPTCAIEECDMSADHEASVVRRLTQDASFDLSPEHHRGKYHSDIESGSAYFASQAAPVHLTPRAARREKMQHHKRTWQRQRDESLAEEYIAGQP